MFAYVDLAILLCNFWIILHRRIDYANRKWSRWWFYCVYLVLFDYSLYWNRVLALKGFILWPSWIKTYWIHYFTAYRNHDLGGLSKVLYLFLTILYSFFNVYQKSKSHHFKLAYKSKYFIAHILFFPINAILFHLAAWYSPSNIVSTHPLRVYYAYGI